MNELAIVETRNIVVQDGQTLEVQMTQQFITKLRQHFGLLSTQPLEDDHVRMYVWGAVNTAVSKAELEINNANSHANTKRVRRTRRRKKDA